MKPILAFETSSPELSIALWTGKGPILEKKIHGYMKHAENILPATDALLKKKKLSIQQVDRFLIGRGPGSFTGLRVGFATLKGFLALKKHSCFGALSLDLVAENINLKDGSLLCVSFDAHREKVYSRIYKRVKGNWIAKGKAQTLTVEEWLRGLPSEITLVGNGADHYREKIEAVKNKTLHILDEKKGYPKASSLIRFFQENPKKLQKLETPKDFIPLYFRLSEAEERMNAGQLKKHKRPKIHASSC